MTQVRIHKNQIVVQSDFAHADACRAVGGGRWHPGSMSWVYPATATVASAVIREFSDGFQATEEFFELAGRARDADEARSLKTASLEDLEPIEGEKFPSWLHQLQAHHFAKAQDSVMLAVGMGGGKTKIAVDLLETWRAGKVLILAPNNVVKVWPKELSVHGHRGWRAENGLYVNRNGRLTAYSVKDRKAKFEDALRFASPSTPVACIINYEAAPFEPMKTFLLSQQWDVVILDESHRIKSPGGKQSRFCETLRTRARRRLALTGTLMPHSPLDVYAQYRFLDPGVFGTNYHRFKQRYAVMGGFEGKQVIGMNEVMQPELERKVGTLAYIISNEELDGVLGLQEPIWPNTIYSELQPKARKAYDQLSEELVTAIDEGVIDVNNALTQLLRLQQITSGHLPVEGVCPKCEGDGCDSCTGTGVRTVMAEVGSEKLDDFAEWLADLPTDEPVVVACRFTHDLAGIRKVCEKQGRRYGELSGRDNAGLTADAKMNPDIDVLGVQIQAGGVGVDLTRAHYVANFSVGFALGDFLQWLKRTHRPGQKHRVVYQNFACSNTIDVQVMKALREREEVVSTVLANAKEGMGL